MPSVMHMHGHIKAACRSAQESVSKVKPGPQPLYMAQEEEFLTFTFYFTWEQLATLISVSVE